MNNNKLQQLQQQFLEMQSKVLEIADSENIEIAMNGKMEIISLTIKASTINDSLIEEIRTTTNTVIRQASQKMQQNIAELQNMAKQVG